MPWKNPEFVALGGPDAAVLRRIFNSLSTKIQQLEDDIAAGGGGGLDAEGVRDTMGTALIPGNNIDITVNDPGDTITIDVEALTSVDVTDFDEAARDAIGAALVAGNNIDVVVDDGLNTITIDVEALTDVDITNFVEAVQDVVGAMVTGNTETDITVSYDDTDGTLDFIVTGGSAPSGGGQEDEVVQIIRTAGDFSTSSTVYTDVTGMTQTITAQDGDKLEIGVSGRWNAAATTKRLDVQITNSSTYVSGVGSGGTGVAAWGGTSGTTFPFGGSIYYTVELGDGVAGEVELTLRAKMSSAVSATLDASDPPLHFWVRNLGLNVDTEERVLSTTKTLIDGQGAMRPRSYTITGSGKLVLTGNAVFTII